MAGINQQKVGTKFILSFLFFWMSSLREGCYCHNPTNNPKQLKTPFVGVVLLSVKKKPPPHHHTTPGLITIRAVLGNLEADFWNATLS
jgi:hypothetical protein